ncbi:ubiquitin carboxyl-hydrolase [Streptococcus cristatus]|uniref:ubiquitin carboxyl-hydrolase n=1 Tax=Streptococcus cristatus TaxID=45634 RepID=UPI001CBE58B9|nr:ubiquitin carboxyl-hydrolase [Streptococcus cristatus]MBZ2151272.1 ubiquitin carboxyl-hydrolase [Streptococcus cristatus]
MKISKLLLIVFIGFLGLGILSACSQHKNGQKEEVTLTAEEKKIIRKQEEALALFLVNNFEDVHKIEFESISKGGFGRPRFIYFSVNDKIEVSTDLEDSYDIQHYGLSYHNNSEVLKRKEVPSKFTKLSEAQLYVVYYGENK